MSNLTTAFGERIDPVAEAEVLYLQLINILARDEQFEAALAKGELTDEATAAIADAFDQVFERNRRFANIFLADQQARREVTRFWFARCYAEVQASAAYFKSFNSAAAAAASA